MFTVLISGYGDIGRRVARRWRAVGEKVYGLRRTEGPDSYAEIIQVDLDMLENSPVDQAGHKCALPAVNIVYHFAAPPSQGVTDPRLQNLLRRLELDLGRQPEAFPTKLVLLSTSAVYGDCAGEWVDEQAVPKPLSDRGKRRWDAEQTAI